jgi:hypothetical protein
LRTPPLSPQLREQLMQVEPSRDPGWGEHRPCLVRLREGREVDRVYVEDVDFVIGPLDRAQPGALEDVLAHLEARSVPLDEVVAIEESPTRLPARFASKIFEGDETGMGYFDFGIVLSDGRVLQGHSAKSVDFLEFPPEIEPAMVSDVIPHQRGWPPDVVGADFLYCLYSGVGVT